MIVGRRYYPLPVPVRALFEVSFACLLMAGAVRALPLSDDMMDVFSLIIKAAVGGIIYLFVTFAINAAGCRKIITDIIKTLRERRTPDLVEAAE